MQALRDMFDTNHNDQLDAGDANFAAFKVMDTNADGTTALMTLAELGIASIDLTTDNCRNVLADGSKARRTQTLVLSACGTPERLPKLQPQGVRRSSRTPATDRKAEGR